MWRQEATTPSCAPAGGWPAHLIQRRDARINPVGCQMKGKASSNALGDASRGCPQRIRSRGKGRTGGPCWLNGWQRSRRCWALEAVERPGNGWAPRLLPVSWLLERRRSFELSMRPFVRLRSRGFRLQVPDLAQLSIDGPARPAGWPYAGGSPCACTWETACLSARSALAS